MYIFIDASTLLTFVLHITIISFPKLTPCSIFNFFSITYNFVLFKMKTYYAIVLLGLYVAPSFAASVRTSINGTENIT